MKRHALSLCLVASLLATGCSRQPRCDDAADTGPKAVDQALVAFLSLASALHHEADLAESRNDVPAALAALTRLLETKTPGSYVEVREVRADTLARAAELSLQRGSLAPAASFLERGLAEVPEETYYRGRLLEVSGLLLEAESKQLEAEAKLQEAEAKKRGAIEKLEEAVRIQQAVIERATLPKASP